MDYKSLPIVGEAPTEQEWEEIKQMVDELIEMGMNPIKILNFKQGSIKFIANPKDGIVKARKTLEGNGWQMMSPYYSQNTVQGFKVAKIIEGKAANVWGD